MDYPVMTVKEVHDALQQRYPMLMVDSVVSLEPGKRIRAIKNVTSDEPQPLGYSPARNAMPCSLIVEAIGQAASILLVKSPEAGLQPEDLLVLGSIDQMVFPSPVVPGDRVEIEVQVLKVVAGIALVKAEAKVEKTIVARGKLGVARTTWQALHNQWSDLSN
jgi:3-hydroxyacyl-[acyl-carrier-protein] dehydratase